MTRYHTYYRKLAESLDIASMNFYPPESYTTADLDLVRGTKKRDHLINSGAATMNGTGKQKKNGKPAMKPFWEIDAKEAAACLDATSWRYTDLGYFRGGGYSAARPKGHAVQPVPIGTRRGAAYSSDFLTEGGMPVTMTRLNLVKGIGPVLQIAEGVTTSLPDAVHDKLDKRTSETTRRDARVRQICGSLTILIGMDADGSSRASPGKAPSRTSTPSWPPGAPTTARSAAAWRPRPRRRRPHHPRVHPPHPRLHAQRGRRQYLPPQLLGLLRHG